MIRPVVLILCVCLAVTAFAGHGRSVAGAASHNRPETSFEQARPAAIALLRALGSGGSTAALEAPQSPADARSLTELEQWLRRIPVGQLRVSAYEASSPVPGRAGVLVHLHATLGSDPQSTELDLGQRLLEVRPTRAGWRVAADATTSGGVVLEPAGLAAIPGARYHVGDHTVVIDATGDDAGSRLALEIADTYTPFLAARYGEDRYMRRSVIFLLPDAESFVRVGEATGFKDLVGEELDGLVFINHPAWKSWSEAGQQGAIVHELTHVATIQMMRAAPTSLVEGLARYEESKVLQAGGYQFNLDDLEAAYRDGYPEMQRWRSRAWRWGLTDDDDIALAYADGMAMTASIIENHGGTAAVERLATEFRLVAPSGNATPAQVRTAFQRALGVSFEAVTWEAQTLVWRATHPTCGCS